MTDSVRDKKEENSGKLQSRPESDPLYRWHTHHIFASDDEWKKAFESAGELLPGIGRFAGTLDNSADRLWEWLEYRNRVGILLDKLFFYAHLKADEDAGVDRYQGYMEKVSALAVQAEKELAFFEPELLRIPELKIRQYLEEKEELTVYRHFIEDLLRSKAHVLDEAGEQLLALSGEVSRTPYQVFSMFNNADIRFGNIRNEKGELVEVTKGNFSVFLRSPQRQVREDAYRSLYSRYQEWRNTLAATLSGAVKRNIFYARSRHYPNALQAALDNYNIPEGVYDNVIKTVNENLQPLHRYNSLRKKMLNLEKLYPWDLYVPLLSELNWKIPYPQAQKILSDALKPLGRQYVSDIQKSFSDGWIDVYENRGKRSGAYSSSVYGAPHPFVLLNYQNLLDDLFTLAHEMGHAMHSFYTLQTQPFIYSNYTIFVAEVASTLNEALLMDHLLKQQENNRQRKLYLLNQYIDQIRGTVYMQTLFAEYEKIIHETAEAGEPLTADYLSRLTETLYLRFYGPDFEMDDLYRVNWSRIPHFYYNFYVYQYVTGFSAATALSRRILAGETSARDAYLHFLSRGKSDYSVNLLKEAGVDMTSPEPIAATARLFSELLDQMESLL
ncbi:MAG: oligoendopeptidase F [Calditrichia bacterium]